MHACTDGRTDGWMDGQTHDGYNAMTIACWPSASGARKRKCWLPAYFPFAKLFPRAYVPTFWYPLLQAISPFLTVFSISFVRQNVALCGNGLNLLLCDKS